MGRPFIVLGDKTSHGGVVIGSSAVTDTHGTRIARQGDLATCPIHGHGPLTTIVSGDPTMVIDGQPAARHGDSCACGATLIAGQAVSSVSEGGAAVQPGPNAAPVAASAPGSKATSGAAKSKPVTTGLGAAVDALAAQSPALQSDLTALKKNKWTFDYGTPGMGSYTDSSSVPPRIVIDGSAKGDPNQIVQTLAHEAGHATYHYAPDISSKDAYVKGALADEGAATLSNIKTQREIKSAGGPDIGIAGNADNHAEYNAAYDAYLKDGDAAAARARIGKAFGEGETASVPVGGRHVKYSEYYDAWYDKTYGKPAK